MKTRVKPSLQVSVRDVRRLKERRAAWGLAYTDFGWIEIEPNQSPKNYLETLCHEWLHCALPTLGERSIVKLEKSLGGMLWRRGYRRRTKLQKT